MSSEDTRPPVWLCPDCSAQVDGQTRSNHASWHDQIRASLETLDRLTVQMSSDLATAEAQARQALERVSQLEARAAWGPQNGPPQYGQGSSWTCPQCDLGELVLVLGGRRPGLRCGNCGRPVSSG